MTEAYEKNKNYQRAANERKRRAYLYLVACAVESGFMKHKQDTVGFNEFMDAIETGAVIVAFAVSETEPPAEVGDVV